MAYRNKKLTMPNDEDLMLQILAISEALYNGQSAIGLTTWDRYRPDNWPTSRFLLSYYGFSTNSEGWAIMIDIWLDMPVKTLSEIQCDAHEKIVSRRWGLDTKPDYTAKPDSQYLAATYSPGFRICEETYKRTGRMILR